MKKDQVYMFTATPLTFAEENSSANPNAFNTDIINTDTIVSYIFCSMMIK